MTDSPSTVEPKQLRDLHIRIVGGKDGGDALAPKA